MKKKKTGQLRRKWYVNAKGVLAAQWGLMLNEREEDGQNVAAIKTKTWPSEVGKENAHGHVTLELDIHR